MTRRSRLAAGNEVAPNMARAGRILGILRDYFAPDAVDSAYQEVVRFLDLVKRAGLLLGISKSSLCYAAGRSPRASASVLRMQNAPPPQQETTPLMARAQKGLHFLGVARATRRLIGSRGGAARQEAPVTAAVAESKGCDNDDKSRVAYRKARKTGKWARTGGRDGRKEPR